MLHWFGFYKSDLSYFHFVLLFHHFKYVLNYFIISCFLFIICFFSLLLFPVCRNQHFSSPCGQAPLSSFWHTATISACSLICYSINSNLFVKTLLQFLQVKSEIGISPTSSVCLNQQSSLNMHSPAENFQHSASFSLCSLLLCTIRLEPIGSLVFKYLMDSYDPSFDGL